MHTAGVCVSFVTTGMQIRVESYVRDTKNIHFEIGRLHVIDIYGIAGLESGITALVRMGTGTDRKGVLGNGLPGG